MKYIMLFLMVIMLNACESAQNFKRPELSQQKTVIHVTLMMLTAQSLMINTQNPC